MLGSDMDNNHESVPLDESKENKPNNRNKKQRGRRTIGRLHILLIVMGIIILMLLIVIVVLVFVRKKEKIPLCSSGQSVDLSEPDNPSIFHDLTSKEVKGMMEFLYKQKELNLTRPAKIKVKTSYIFTAELHLPEKADAVSYLDSRAGQKPPRQARVIIFRGDLIVPKIMEIVVTPLPNPTHYTIWKDNIPFQYRPVTGPDYDNAVKSITKETDQKARQLLRESFGGTLTNCSEACLAFKFMTPVSSAVSGRNRRLYWFWMYQFVEFYILHPVDFAVLVDMDDIRYSIEKVWFNKHAFDTIDSLVIQYSKNTMQKKPLLFPYMSDTLFSKLNRRDTEFSETSQRPPISIEPDGRRYSVKGQHVKYMNWEFDFRMSSTRGPQLNDIRFRNNRIVYELALQEISVFYSGYKPTQMFANYFDTTALIGPQDKGLVPGVDCPSHATFMPASHVLESSEKIVTFKNAFCVFEINTGMPLRRHHSFASFRGSFYEGMSNAVLILRSILTIVNYDYILDFIFYQTGALEVKVVSTGYILATPLTVNAASFGTQINDNISGNLHHHMFSYKVDLDIEGSQNRYRTLDISTTVSANHFNPDPTANIVQNQFIVSEKKTESEAAYKFNFDTPKYHLFYSNLKSNKFGEPRSYRLLSRGMSKQLLPEGKGNEPAMPWMRYQIAVTKRKENERICSSIYSGLDAKSPVVNFDHFLKDNENILDQDLVAWVSMGVQHIPHTEDLPVTHTPGMDLSFFLLPYNYFPEDPAMGSRDSVRIEPNIYNNPDSGVKVTGFDKEDLQCKPPVNDYQQVVEADPGILFEK
ncbi:putative amine oxidase [copper-containing] [Saccostrea echinata]|uniref:putative amine oxidase [copper-containing] n=1 Tax=Saccostrea echinata TaxID=191078 RepID=UPI002A830817|nr:putative amine oxidase [copper-containing] [Saccostrea echinata]